MERISEESTLKELREEILKNDSEFLEVLKSVYYKVSKNIEQRRALSLLMAMMLGGISKTGASKKYYNIFLGENPDTLWRNDCGNIIYYNNRDSQYAFGDENTELKNIDENKKIQDYENILKESFNNNKFKRSCIEDPKVLDLIREIYDMLFRNAKDLSLGDLQHQMLEAKYSSNNYSEFVKWAIDEGKVANDNAKLFLLALILGGASASEADMEGSTKANAVFKKKIAELNHDRNFWYKGMKDFTGQDPTNEKVKDKNYNNIIQNKVKTNTMLKELKEYLEISINNNDYTLPDKIDYKLNNFFNPQMSQSDIKAKKEKLKDLCNELVNKIMNNSNGAHSMNSGNNKNVNSMVEDKIKEFNQVIFTGAPGTGKTYSVRKYVKEFGEDRYKFVQFHPSYDYSDFIEGLRPVNLDSNSPENSEIPTFVRMDGVFKKFCRKIVEKNLVKISGINNNNELNDEVLDKYKDDIDNDWYYFIVDEVNRADLSKVFGEIMFGLEESYRGIENRFDTQYMNLKTYEVDKKTGKARPMKFDCFAKGFFIPRNLKFIGTMNDIDRSVESFDFALRRRFHWIDIKANEVMLESLKSILSGKVNDIDINELSSKVISMNNVISGEIGKKIGLNEAYHIGPAYFKNFDGNNLQNIFNNNIESILKEYARGRRINDINMLISECRDKLLN